jgi:hypothetical protein
LLGRQKLELLGVDLTADPVQTRHVLSETTIQPTVDKCCLLGGKLLIPLIAWPALFFHFLKSLFLKSSAQPQQVA